MRLMKTTDAAELHNGSQWRDEVSEREPASLEAWPEKFIRADSTNPHGVDGPDELAFAIGESAG